MLTCGIAVFGCGYWGQNLVRNFHELGVLTAVCDPSPESLKKAGTIAPGAELSGNFAEVLKRDDIRAVVLATPAETHHRLALEAFAHGKHVMVEKPMALTVREGEAMRAAAEKAGRVLMVGHLLEYHPAVLKLREMVSGGVLGRLCYLYSNRLNFGKIRIEENALWSFAPHDIAVILRLVGEPPLEVTCSGGSYITPNLADVTVSCLHFRSGLKAHIFVSWLNPFKEQKLVLVGDRRMAEFNDVSKDRKLVLYDQHVDLDHRLPVLQKGEPTAVEIGLDEPLRNECMHFIECVESGVRPLTGAREGLDVLRVLAACQQSLELSGRPVYLEEKV